MTTALQRGDNRFQTDFDGKMEFKKGSKFYQQSIKNYVVVFFIFEWILDGLWEGFGSNFGRVLGARIDTKINGILDGFWEGFRYDFGSQNASKMTPKVDLAEP